MRVEIEGMSCEHCAKVVKEALSRLPGVEAVEVELQAGEARLAGSPDPEAVRQAVEEAGYRVRRIERGGAA